MTDEHHADRRSFLKTGAIAGTALVAGASVMAQQVAADTDASNRPLTPLTAFERAVKRTLDVVGSVTAILFLSPLFRSKSVV